jgi:hypothetical protein
MTDQPEVAKPINDGGYAFPFSPAVDAHGDIPAGSYAQELGMTKREEYASRAMAGMLAGLFANPDSTGWTISDIAKEAVAHADALIAALTPS